MILSLHESTTISIVISTFDILIACFNEAKQPAISYVLVKLKSRLVEVHDITVSHTL